MACPWLIKRFIDPDAQFLYVPAEKVLDVASQQGATPFDTRGANLDHRGGKCTFEVLLEEYKLTNQALHMLGKIVHGADIPSDVTITPESAGLKALADGLYLTCPDDHRKLELAFPLYDALYAYCQQAVAGERGMPQP